VDEPPECRNDVFEEELLSSLATDSLHLILLPTEQCNFRCTYCYEDFTIGRMGRDTVQGVKRLIDRRLGDLRSLGISWFGGEPLLARAIVEDISTHITLAAASRPKLHYSADMTTNGYLLDTRTIERLAELGVRLHQISLDGPEEIHDRTRVRADGRGSFNRIWRNLLAIRDGVTPVQVLLRIHLHPNNLAYMPKFLTQIRETFLRDSRFSVLLKPVEHLGGPNDANVEIIGEKERARIIGELESLILEDGDARRLFDAPQVCYAARPNSLMIRANGAIGKCTVALTDPANIIGKLLPDGSLKIDNAHLRPWLRGWSSRDWQALGCPYGEFPRREPQLLQIGRPPQRESVPL
jgi:uncharacterized protein